MNRQIFTKQVIFWTIVLASITAVVMMYGIIVGYQILDSRAKATMIAIPTATAEALEVHYQKGLGYINIER